MLRHSWSVCRQYILTLSGHREYIRLLQLEGALSQCLISAQAFWPVESLGALPAAGLGNCCQHCFPVSCRLKGRNQGTILCLQLKHAHSPIPLAWLQEEDFDVAEHFKLLSMTDTDPSKGILLQLPAMLPAPAKEIKIEPPDKRRKPGTDPPLEHRAALSLQNLPPGKVLLSHSHHFQGSKQLASSTAHFNTAARYRMQKTVSIKMHEMTQAEVKLPFCARKLAALPSLNSCLKRLVLNLQLGKLLLFKSGKVKLQMGGVLMDVSLGSKSQTVQHCLGIDMAGKSAKQLAHIEHRAIVTPDMGQLLRSDPTSFRLPAI